MAGPDRARRTVAAICLFAAALAVAAVILATLTGGITWRGAGWRAAVLSIRDPWRPLAIAVVLIVVSRLVAGARFAALLRSYAGSRDRLPARIAALVAACVFVFAVARGTRAAGGSDSSCYALQAEAFAHGHATLRNPVAALLPDVPSAVFAPSGFIPSPRSRADAVPICGPGLSLVMAPAYLLRPGAIFFVVPVTAALLVWLTFVYGRRVDDEVTGVCAAVLLACSPIFLYQAVQPMSDVPAAAVWMAALIAMARRNPSRYALGGGFGALAVLIRPNLAPLVLLLPLKEFRLNADATKTTRSDAAPVKVDPVASAFRRNLIFVAALLPAVALLLALNAVRYGGPLSSGYGETGTLFSLTHVVPNLTRYPRWLLETQTPLLLLVFGVPWWLASRPEQTWLVVISLVAVALVVLTYLLYTVFDDWWYIRFLLPALPILIALSVAVLRRLTLWLPFAGGRPVLGRLVLAAIVGMMCLWYVHVARERRAMELQALESRFRLAGGYAARDLPENAIVIAAQQSGSIRFYGHRDTIAWDQIPSDALDVTIARLRAAGRVPFIALEDAEQEPFRRRFAGQRAGALDKAPIATIRALVRVHFYDAPLP